MSGILPGEPSPQTKQMILPLDTIKFDPKPTKYKRGKTVDRPPEETFQLSQIPPVANGQYVKNSYELTVKVKFKGCTCNSKIPSVSIPLTIIPPIYADSYGFEEPEGYAPIELGYFSFEL